jgi:DNA-binding NtrC family response regulator
LLLNAEQGDGYYEVHPADTDRAAVCRRSPTLESQRARQPGFTGSHAAKAVRDEAVIQREHSVEHRRVVVEQILDVELEIEPGALPAKITERAPQPLVQASLPANPTLEIIERAYIHWVLQAEGGNKTRAAEVLGIDPSTLYRKLLRYGMEQ